MADLYGFLDGLFISDLRIRGFPQPAIDRELQYRKLARNMPNNLRIPEYKIKLINAGYLFDDGKRVIGNLTNVVRFLEKECDIEATEKFLQESFLKPDGSKYSLVYCRKIMARIHDIDCV